MEIEKKKMDPEKKMKLIYSIELLVFSVVFLVLGILEMSNVIHISARYSLIFRWVTIFGGCWVLIDFFWAFFSKKRQKRVAIIDKIILLPLGLYLITYDIIGFALNPNIETTYAFYQFGMSGPFIYIACVYIFEGIYHWYHPVPGLLDGLNEKDKGEVVDTQEASLEEESKQVSEEEKENE